MKAAERFPTVALDSQFSEEAKAVLNHVDALELLLRRAEPAMKWMNEFMAEHNVSATTHTRKWLDDVKRILSNSDEQG